MQRFGFTVLTKSWFAMKIIVLWVWICHSQKNKKQKQQNLKKPNTAELEEKNSSHKPCKDLTEITPGIGRYIKFTYFIVSFVDA